MKKLLTKTVYIGVLGILIFSCSETPEQNVSKKLSQEIPRIPYLHKQGNTLQLIVDNKPFIILGGELGNSSFTSMEYMESIWPKLQLLNLNTVLAPVYWELIEPNEGQFDFMLYDQLITEARKHNLKLVLLWFGSWKNSMSSHAPSWVKKDQERFPRVQDDKGKSHEILTPFSQENLMADLKAFKALMQHIKEFDGESHTVIMLQSENEIGMLPTARDYSSLANNKFTEDVPVEFIEYLKKNKNNLSPEFKEKWAAQGYRETGNWEEIFGTGVHTDEIFMAWFYAQFINHLIEAGKEIYPLPMYVNAALNRPGWLPGEYPSAGPLPHIMDVWKAGGPSIDFLAPDIYFPNIKHWCDLYTRQDNPLFIPETVGGAIGAVNALFTIGHYESLGFAPFSIESGENPEEDDLGKSYDIISQISHLITKYHGQGKIDGILVNKQNQETKLIFGEYELTVRHSYTLGYERESKEEFWMPGGAILIQTGENEFYLAGSGIVITFSNKNHPALNVGILKTEEGRFDNAQWTVIRHLNGDQIHQGRHIRIFKKNFSIQRFELYNYK